jgi:iron-sulfur cluster assembly accessory protein
MIKITDAARNKIVSILTEEKASIIRFGLQGSGCAGFQYFLSIDENQEETDFEYALDDSHKLIVDASSSMYLEDAEIDYKKDIMGESFVFNNPNSVSKCGCGNSISFD